MVHFSARPQCRALVLYAQLCVLLCCSFSQLPKQQRTVLLYSDVRWTGVNCSKYVIDSHAVRYSNFNAKLYFSGCISTEGGFARGSTQALGCEQAGSILSFISLINCKEVFGDSCFRQKRSVHNCSTPGIKARQCVCPSASPFVLCQSH